jgi:asparagine synthase (glutamine-hydrolysing)
MTSMAKVFFSEEVKSAARGLDPMAALEKALPDGFARWDGFLKAQYLEGTILLPGYILSSQGDRVAMAHAVEGRFPFLDHRLVEFGFSLPPRLKMKALREKHILKVAAMDLAPRGVIERPKQPYRAPDAASFFDAATGRARRDYVDILLGEGKLKEHGIFDPEAVGVLVRKAKMGRATGAKDNMALVGILSTQLVMEQFVQRVHKWN